MANSSRKKKAKRLTIDQNVPEHKVLQFVLVSMAFI